LRAATADGELALLVPPDDPQALATALDRLHSDAALAAWLGAQGRQRMANQTWQKRARRIIETFAPDLLSPVSALTPLPPHIRQ
jgi:glycosyltransferase involved in cell wall biosynthesis